MLGASTCLNRKGAGVASVEEVQEQVRSRYATVAVTVAHGQGCGCSDSGCCGDGSGSCCATAEALEQTDAFGSGLYAATEQAELPEEALLASLGCGNPVAVADLHPGETVAGSTCCCQPAGSLRTGLCTGST